MNYPDYKSLIINIAKAVATVVLNRPEVHNAFDFALITELTDVFTRLKDDERIRAVVLAGAGKSFCAGGDLNWMRSVTEYNYEQNYQESLSMARMMYMINTHPKPVIAKVNGPAMGGGVGLLSVCDIAVAAGHAKFALSEVRLGLIPAVVSPFVIARIGQARARELFITGEAITAQKALDYGLLNHVVPASELDRAVEEKLEMIMQNGPEAISSAKKLAADVSRMVFPELTEYTASLIAQLRMGDEAKEGMAAFLEKRKPQWVDCNKENIR